MLRPLHCSRFALAAMATIVGLLGAPASTLAESASGGSWYRVTLEQGEAQGYAWAVGAAGPKHEPLREICTKVATLEPLQDESPYIEGGNSMICGEMPNPTESMALGTTFGPDGSGPTLLATIYRPIVRKVTFVFDTGERRVYFPQTPMIPSRVARGIPVFRYLAVVFDGLTCTRRMTMFDGGGSVLESETRPPCRAGAGNM